MKRILCCGYIALDLISYKERLIRRAGGTAGNVACNLSFLGWSAAVGGSVGHDSAGRALQHDLRRCGVSTEQLSLRPEGGTPVVLHEISERGHRFQFHCPECGRRFPKYRPLDEVTARALCEQIDVDVFFFDRASVGTAVIAETLRERGTLIVFEPSTQGREPERCIRAADVVKFSSERASAVEPLMQSARPRLRVVTDGAKGAHAFVGATEIHVPAFPANLVDAGGAGDWTTAGMLWQLVSGQRSWTAPAVKDALRFGQALAAVSCAYPGARSVSEHLSRDEVFGAAKKIIDEHRAAPIQPVLLRPARAPTTGCVACLT